MLEELRKIRNLENPKLKPSPYLKDKFIDEFGEEQNVKLRDYQCSGIMNICMSPRHINGFDTGLGKSLISLASVSYIWLVEPTYVPIVVTTKSSLFQWESECHKFMKNMSVLVVSGQPTQRHSTYAEFFDNYNINNKRIMIVTYDSIFRDLRSGIISEKTKGQGSTKLKENTKISKQKLELAKKELEEYSQIFNDKFLSLPYEIQSCATNLIRGKDVMQRPDGWISEYDNWVLDYITKKIIWSQCLDEYNNSKSLSSPTRNVRGILDYIQDLKSNHPDTQFMLIMDEMHKLKNHRSQIHESVKELSMNCNRIYGLTATPIKNRLMEFFSLFRVIKSDLFPKISHFMNDYCVTKLQPIGGGRQVPIVVGYKNLQQFISKIEPYYFSKKKHEVAEQLPKLISREIPCELSDIQEELYDMAESGLLGKNTDITQAEMLQSLTLCQQAVNSPYLIKDENGNPFEGPSTKEETLIDLLENDLSEKKVIIFSRFEKMISRLENLLDEAKIKNVRITGKEHKAQDREKAKNKFQDPNSGMNVILITTAGSESINLQAAEYIIFFDSCWSFGDYIQLVGRAVRIGSRNDSVVAIHFVGEKQNGEKTIDQHVLNILRKKKKLIDVVAGQNIPDALDFKSKNEMFELFSEMYSSSASEANSNKTNKRQEDKKKPKKKPKEDVLSVKSEDNCKISLVSLDASDI